MQPSPSTADESSQFAGRHLSVETLFFLATLGGAEVCCLDKSIGNFTVGKEFDALLVDPLSRHCPSKNPGLFLDGRESVNTIFEKCKRLFALRQNH